MPDCGFFNRFIVDSDNDMGPPIKKGSDRKSALFRTGRHTVAPLITKFATMQVCNFFHDGNYGAATCANLIDVNGTLCSNPLSV
jgi:hypothetical protein